jgi:hypothetical protein
MKNMKINVLAESAVSKICTKCGIDQPFSKYHKKVGGKYGLRADCTDCVSAFQATYRQVHSEKIKADKRQYHKENPDVKRKHHLKLHYNMTLEQYQTMLAKQDGKCAICSTTESRNAQHKHFYVDHNHKTNEVRGLLCYRCNSAIGYLDDSFDNCVKAAEYLKVHNG